MYGTIFVHIQLLWYVKWVFGLIIFWRFGKSIETMLGKKEVCRQQLSLTFQQKRKAWKRWNKKKCHNKTKESFQPSRKWSLPTFSRNYLTISKNPISINQATIRQIHGLIILHFHICNLLHDLYQLTKYSTICFLLISKCPVTYHDTTWYHSRPLFLSKWSGTQACPPFNMNWFRCQIVLKSVMGAALVEPKVRWLL